MAQGISMIAIPWYFAQQEEMARFGLIYVLTNVLLIIWVPYSGVFIDKYNRKHIFLATTALFGSLVLGIAMYGHYQDGLPWYLVALVFMLTFFNYAIHYPNLYAFIQEISEPAYYGRITSYIEIQGQLTTIAAGAGAAMLLEGNLSGEVAVLGHVFKLPFIIEPWPIQWIFTLDAATYFLAFLIILMLQVESLKERRREAGSILIQLKVGIDYLKKHFGVLIFGLASYSVFVSVLLTTFFLSAIYVNNHLLGAASVYAISEVYYAIGAVLAGVAIRRIFSRVSLPESILIMTLIAMGLFAVLAISRSVVLFYVMFFLLGLSNAGTRIQRVTYLFSHLPNQVYGRVNSIFFLSNILFRIFFLSLFSLPFFSAYNNVIYAFAIISVFLLASAALLLYYIRHYEERDNVPEH